MSCLMGSAAKAGSISITINLPVGYEPGKYEVAVTIIDTTGRRSNSIVTEVVLSP